MAKIDDDALRRDVQGGEMGWPMIMTRAELARARELFPVYEFVAVKLPEIDTADQVDLSLPRGYRAYCLAHIPESERII